MQPETQLIREIFQGTVIEEYGEFLRWLHNHHCVRLASPYLFLVPMPRIRQGIKDAKEECVRIVVEKKLPPDELHPNSAEEWNALYGIWLNEQRGRKESFFGIGGTKYIQIPKMLAGWPTDICQ